jgi:hypothetical protein
MQCRPERRRAGPNPHHVEATMKKLKLDLDQLHVESFDTRAQERTRGTVAGHVPLSYDTNCYNCDPSLDYTCDSCDVSCAGSCVDTCADTCANTCPATCQYSCNGTCASCVDTCAYTCDTCAVSCNDTCGYYCTRPVKVCYPY